MKRLISLFCAVMLLGSLAGCLAEKDGIRPQDPEAPGSSLIDYDPDRQIFFNSEAVCLECYVGLGVPYFILPIYSKNYIDPADISVAFPVDAPIAVEVSRVEGIEGKTAASASGEELPENVMPYYVYQAYQGGYAQALADARQAKLDLAFIVDKTKDGPLWAEYEALTEKDLPKFYVYHIRVDLSQVPAPPETTTWSLEKMDITIEGKTYEAKLGCVRLYNLEDFVWQGNTGIPQEDAGMFTENIGELYSGGIVKLPRIPIEVHDRDYTNITGAWVVGEDWEILNAEMIISNPQKGTRFRQVGSGGYDSFIDLGETAFLELTVRNEKADMLLSSIQFQLVVETFGADLVGAEEQWERRDSVYGCKVYTFNSGTKAGHYENYAIIFDGVDMKPYYDYYFENMELWRKDYAY